MNLYYDEPTQVKFADLQNEVDDELIYRGGIAYCGELICGCCGAVIMLEELATRYEDYLMVHDEYTMEDLWKEYSYWVPLNEEIIGGDV